jgi:hypothetical protein
LTAVFSLVYLKFTWTKGQIRHFLRTTLNSIKDLRGLGLDRNKTTENNDGKDKLSVMLVGEEVMQQRLIDYFTEKQKRTKRKNG